MGSLPRLIQMEPKRNHIYSFKREAERFDHRRRLYDDGSREIFKDSMLMALKMEEGAISREYSIRSCKRQGNIFSPTPCS